MLPTSSAASGSAHQDTDSDTEMAIQPTDLLPPTHVLEEECELSDQETSAASPESDQLIQH